MRYLDKDKLNEKVTRRAEEDMAACRIPAAVLSVWQDGREVLTRGFGGADEHTVFRMASMTKPITAVATMIAVERGLLSLDDLVEDYLPQFADRRVAMRDMRGEVMGGEPAHQKITIRHLLCHSSGHCYRDSLGARVSEMTDEERRTLEHSVAVYATLMLDFHPGESQGYSGVIAWDILVTVLQMVTGEDFLAFITREILTPCGMADTTFVPTAEQWARMIPMHIRVDEQNAVDPMWEGCVFENFPCTHYLGGAGLISTLSDYMNFAQMLLNGGEYTGHRILSADSVRQMATPQLPLSANPGAEPWGLGVRVIRGAEYARLPEGAFGWSGAYGTHFWVDPVNRITAVYMKNSKYDGGSGAVTSAHFEEDVTAALREDVMTDCFAQMKKNTVNAYGQLKDTERIRFVNPTGTGKRVLFIGNSITLHGVKPEIGWYSAWGMAASAPEKDYVHRVMAQVQKTDADAAFCVCQVANWERNYKNGAEALELFQTARDFEADVLIMRFVENCPAENLQPDLFCKELGRLLDYLDPKGTAHRVITTGFWRHPLDEAIRHYAAKGGFPLVELGDLGEREDMKAIGLFQHEGVANHPGDSGMERIAERIVAALNVK